jgi:3-oxoacyl-(acyl-carrier-protein) synthase/malonyl CoA-acyl carrier protein transacylase/NAD(P)-dependent dehydrogenase (short-subunit alcohol dehydrogenase family)
MDLSGGAGKLVFTFPGQGSYSAPVLEELFRNYPCSQQFEAADRISRRILGHAFLPLAEGNPAHREQALKAFPSLDQIAIYVTNVLIADVLMSAGVLPDLLLGHSFGELAALAAGGVYSFETGLSIVCQRCISLLPLGTVGKMAALSCGSGRATSLIEASGGKTLQIAVVNHDRQTVISGNEAELTALGNVAARQGVNLTILGSRYPFHSALLGPAVTPFRAMLCSYAFRQPVIPVFMGTENTFYTAEVDLADSLSAQFIRRLDFRSILSSLYEAGYSRFIECGAGEVLTGIVSKALDGKAGVLCRATAPRDKGVATGTAAILTEFERGVPRRAVDSVGDLLQDVQAVLRRTSRVLEKAAGAVVSPAPLPEPAAEAGSEPESLPYEPIAIVAMGCVLPNARNAKEFWDNICNGVTGIVDSSRDDPTLVQDFLAGRNGADITIVPDKTYTLLYGSVGTIEYVPELLSSAIERDRFESMSRAEKLLALATAQSLRALKTGLARYADDRLQCIVGATGDGCGEYDEALFRENLHERLTELTPDPGQRAKLGAVLNKAWSGEFGGSPGEKLQKVVDSVLGRQVRMYIVDAACSSSLYSIHLGMRALHDRSVDAVLAGGVFAPGPANSALFAQFRGLAPEACRPLDAAADGVAFGHGSGVLILKRLSDAIADGDHIAGVVRAVGVSSDGKSPAINVPRSEGQALAVRRAYENSGIDESTIQYVEAHATGTPVGDAVEFKALCDSFSGKARAGGERRAPIELGSIKSLVGHTGWTAGATSVIKLCKAFEHRTVPYQYNFNKTGPEIPLETSPFTISKAAHDWPDNADGLPRRAAINGFGFGGTNAHLVLEEYSTSYHAKLCSPKPSAPSAKVAVIDWATLFPSKQQLAEAESSGERRFDRKLLRLPKGKMLLPDVLDHMDPSQYLAALAAEQVLGAIREQWPELRSDIGVVLGVEDKTDCGVRINQRVFLDRLKRRALECAEDGFRPDVHRFLEQLSEAIRKDIIVSGPYTLPGLMPNLVAGRVSSMFDLHGPNIVIDAGADSLFQSIDVAAGFLAHGVCKIVLAGGINAVRIRPEDCEGAFMMALTTPEIAKEYGLPVKCLLSMGANGAVRASSAESANFRGAHGIVEIFRALRDNQGQEITLSNAGPQPRTSVPASASLLGTVSTEGKPEFVGSWGGTRSPYVYVEGTPIYHYTPVMVPAEIETAAPASLRSRKLLFLTDRTDRWVDLERSGALTGFNFQVLGPMESEKELTAALERLAGSFDTIVAVQSLDGGSSILSGPRSALADLLFTVCRQAYSSIESRQVWVGSLSLNAFRSQNRLDPHTGLAAGFLKSLARELPDSTCRILNTDETSLATALRQLEAEFGRPCDGCEICYQGGRRHSIQLSKTDCLSDGAKPGLDSNSVVLATGGGRGVTAVLAEELLNRFGCTVIALGRTDPSSIPPYILAMDEVQLFNYEQQFYKEQIALGTGKKITELKKDFKNYQSALEVSETVRRLSALPGRFEYISADLTSSESVASVVESVFQRYGRVSLVLHGAGTQVSKVLPKKTLRDFQGVVSAKLDSLRYIYQACRKHGGEHPTAYHILTSAFSYMGNDGQEDYGAANETLNRLAAVMDNNRPGENWTSVAWLGWAGIGMTRGLEYAALAARRGLRGVTKEEGQKIFSALLDGRATAPINVTLSEGEIEFYKVKIAAALAPPPAAPRRNAMVIEREVSVEDAPYLRNHVVDGVPTLPGVFLMILMAEAALDLRPGLKIVAFEDVAFRRFVRLRKDGTLSLRLDASVASEDTDSTLVRVFIRTDFVHKNGMVLQKDVELCSLCVRLASSVAAAPKNGITPLANGKLAAASPLEDPYLMDGSPVKLGGPFRSLQNITAGPAERNADYRLRDAVRSASGDYRLLDLIMLDSLLRFGGIYQESHQVFPIYVPEGCRTLKIFYDFTNPDEKTFTGSLRFTGFNPQPRENDRLIVGPVEASDLAGRTLALLDGGLCRRMGEVRNGS